jgi:hypothetical protein
MCVCFVLNGLCSCSVRKAEVAVRLEKQKGIVMGWWAKKRRSDSKITSQLRLIYSIYTYICIDKDTQEERVPKNTKQKEIWAVCLL